MFLHEFSSYHASVSAATHAQRNCCHSSTCESMRVLHCPAIDEDLDLPSTSPDPFDFIHDCVAVCIRPLIDISRNPPIPHGAMDGKLAIQLVRLFEKITVQYRTACRSPPAIALQTRSPCSHPVDRIIRIRGNCNSIRFSAKASNTIDLLRGPIQCKNRPRSPRASS